jgi:hypothetical protein
MNFSGESVRKWYVERSRMLLEGNMADLRKIGYETGDL